MVNSQGNPDGCRLPPFPRTEGLVALFRRRTSECPWICMMLTPCQRHAGTAVATRTECAAKELTKRLYQHTGYSNPLLIGKEKGRTNMYSVNNIVVALYDTHLQAEQAIKELQQCGFDMKRLSIVAKNPHVEEQVIGFYNAGDRMKQWGGQGAFWGGIWGLLFGAAFFAIPGLG